MAYKRMITAHAIIDLCVLLSILYLAGCGANSEAPVSSSTDTVSSEEPAQAAYSSLLSGDRSLLDDAQSDKWWIPDFPDDGLEYEYTYLDLDGDGVDELLIQMVDDPCGYNAVFHYEDGKLFCWNSDAMEMSSRDYPLRDGTMVHQYDYNGIRSYTLFRYRADGEQEEISGLYAREELIPEESDAPCPYYEIDGEEVDKTVFEEQLDSLITGRLLERAAWTTF